jgi:hypothetical protein
MAMATGPAKRRVAKRRADNIRSGSRIVGLIVSLLL